MSAFPSLPALREGKLSLGLRPRCCVAGCTTTSSADRPKMGQVDRSQRRRGFAGSPRHKICASSLDEGPLIDGVCSGSGSSVSPVPPKQRSEQAVWCRAGVLVSLTCWRYAGISMDGQGQPLPLTFKMSRHPSSRCVESCPRFQFVHDLFSRIAPSRPDLLLGQSGRPSDRVKLVFFAKAIDNTEAVSTKVGGSALQ